MELESYLKKKQTHLPNVAVKNDMHFTHNINFLFLFYTDAVIFFLLNTIKCTAQCMCYSEITLCR